MKIAQNDNFLLPFKYMTKFIVRIGALVILLASASAEVTWLYIADEKRGGKWHRLSPEEVRALSDVEKSVRQFEEVDLKSMINEKDKYPLGSPPQLPYVAAFTNSKRRVQWYVASNGGLITRYFAECKNESINRQVAKSFLSVLVRLANEAGRAEDQ